MIICKRKFWQFITAKAQEATISGFVILTCYFEMVHVLRSSRISRKSGALIVRYSQKKERIAVVFYCSENPSIVHNFGNTDPIQVGFSTKCTSPNEHFNQIENCNRHMFDFRLIPLDSITFDNLIHFIGVKMTAIIIESIRHR